MILNLINDLLDLAKLENKSFNLNFDYFNFFDIVQKSLENIDY